MNHELILSALPDNKEEAVSMEEIALAMGLKISSYSNRTRTQRRLARSLRALIKWGWVNCERRQRKVGHKFWYNAYWKTALARQTEEHATAIGPVEV